MPHKHVRLWKVILIKSQGGWQWEIIASWQVIKKQLFTYTEVYVAEPHL